MYIIYIIYVYLTFTQRQRKNHQVRIYYHTWEIKIKLKN